MIDLSKALVLLMSKYYSITRIAKAGNEIGSHRDKTLVKDDWYQKADRLAARINDNSDLLNQDRVVKLKDNDTIFVLDKAKAKGKRVPIISHALCSCRIFELMLIFAFVL